MVAVEARGQPPAAPKWSPKKVWLSLLLALPENPFSDSKHVWIFIAEESLKEIYFLGKSFLFLFSPLHRRFLFSNLLLAVYYLTTPSITHLLRPSSQMQRRKKVPFSHCYSTTQCLKITQNVAFELLAFWHFPPIFVLLKLAYLVTLFDRKLQVFKNSPKRPFSAFLINFCPLKM